MDGSAHRRRKEHSYPQGTEKENDYFMAKWFGLDTSKSSSEMEL